MLYSKHYINGKKTKHLVRVISFWSSTLLTRAPPEQPAYPTQSHWPVFPLALGSTGDTGAGGHPRRAGPIGRTERDAPRRNPPKQRHPRPQRRHQARGTPRRRETRLCSRAHFLPPSVRRPREVILTSPQPPSKFPLNFVQQHFRRPKQQVPPPRFISDSLARWDVPF